jgi:heptosyltransferase-2
MRILVVAPAWVGDGVLAQPLFMRLHEHHPDLELDVLAPQWTLPLFARMPQVQRTFASPFAHGELKLGARLRLARTLRAERYDQAIVLPNSFKSALIPWFARIRLRTGFRGETRYGVLNDVRILDKHALPQMAERFALLAETPGAALPRPLPQPRLTVNDGQRDATLNTLGLAPARPIAALCPGAEYGPAKRWPAVHFTALAQQLIERGCDVWLIGSAKDEPIGAAIARASAAVNLCGRTSLDQAIDLLSCANVVVSNDSGLMHVAAALGRPLIALYGSSSPEFTPPLSPQATVLWLHIECSPCFQRECPLGHFRCMLELTPERVMSAIDFDTIGIPQIASRP